MRNENRVILLGVLMKRTKQEEEELTELLIMKQDWAYIVGQLYYHRIAGNFFYGLGDTLKKYMVPEFKQSLELLVKAQEICGKERLAALKGVFEEFDRQKVHYATLKGLTYSLTMYPYGIRKSNDCDILVLENDLKKVDAILLADGYFQSSDGGRTVAGRREKLIQRMNYHDLTPYYKPLESEFQKHLKIDINFHFDEKDNDITGRIFEVGTVLEERDGYIGRRLDYATHLLHLCVHLYREVSNSIWVNKKRDLLLYKTVDIANTIRYIDKSDILRSIELSKKLNIDKQVYFTFYYLHQFYKEEIYKEYMDMFNFSNLDFLKKIHVEGENRDIMRDRDYVEATFDLYLTNADYIRMIEAKNSKA